MINVFLLQVGKVWRPGRTKASTACGALLALLGEIKTGRVNLQMDPNDLEMSLLKQQIMSHLKYGQQPSLVELTYAVHECILNDVRRTAEAAVDLDKSEYVIVSGIQVHAGFSKSMFWPGSINKYTSQGVEDLYEEYAECVSEWSEDSAQFFEMEKLLSLQNRERACRLAAENGDVDLLTKMHTPTHSCGVALNKVLDHKKLTLLHVAARAGQGEVVKMLLEMVAPEDPDFLHAVDIDRMTAMDYAVLNLYDDIAEMLMEQGSGLQGEFLTTQLLEAVVSGSLHQLQRLMWFAKDISVAIETTDKDGCSLAQLAMKHKAEVRIELLEMLLSFGANIDKMDFWGNQAATTAEAMKSNDPKLHALLAADANSAALSMALTRETSFDSFAGMDSRK